MRRRKWSLTLPTTFFLFLTSLGLAACAGSSGLQRPPFEVPFDAGQIGSQTELKVKIVEKNEYLLGLGFYVKETPEEAVRLGIILGAPQLLSGKWVEKGAPMTFRIRVYSELEKKNILDNLIDHPRSRPGYTGRIVDIARIRLEPGVYGITLEYVQGGSELAAIPAKLSFAKAHHAK